MNASNTENSAVVAKVEIPEILKKQIEKQKRSVAPVMIETTSGHKWSWLKSWLRLSHSVSEREKDHVIKIVVEDSLTAVKVMELAIEEGWSRAAILHPGQSDGVTQAMIHDFNSLSSPLAIITHAHPSAGALMPHGTLRVLWFDFPVKWQEVYYYHYYSLASLILLCATRSDRDRSRIGNMATQCLKEMDDVPHYLAQWLSSHGTRNLPLLDFYWLRLKSQYPGVGELDITDNDESGGGEAEADNTFLIDSDEEDEENMDPSLSSVEE